MYDHNIKAGNRGDVVKHTALIAVASELMKRCNGTFRYADAYAGYAYNPLKTNGEWRDGIGVLHDSGFSSKNPAVEFWQELWKCKAGLRGSVYPGSSLFMLKLCLERGLSFHARLWDISPSVVSQLVMFYDPDEVSVFPRPARADDFIDYTPDLLLIDPPDVTEVEKVLELFAVAENTILWLPICTKAGVETEESCRAYHICKERGLSIASVVWDSAQNTRGCRLICRVPINAKRALREAFDYIANEFAWHADYVNHN